MIKAKAFLLSCVVAALMPCSAQCAENSPRAIASSTAFDALLERAKKATDVNEAEQLYDKAIQLNPNSAVAYEGRGRKRLTAGNQQGLPDVDKAIVLDDKFAKAYRTRGWAKLVAGNYKPALEDLDNAIRLGDDTNWVYEYRGACYLDLNQLQPACNDFEAALQRDPKSIDALLNMAMVQQKLGEYPASLAFVERAIAIDPKNASIYRIRGDYKQDHLSDYAGAIKDYSESIGLGANADSYRGRAQANVRLKHWSHALSDADSALRLKPRDAMALNIRGCARNNSGDSNAAISDFNQAISIDPGNFTFYVNRAQAYENVGKVSLAEKDRAKANALQNE